MQHNTHILGRIRNSLMKTAVATGVLCAFVMSSSLAVAAPISNASFGIGGAFTTAAGTHLGNTDSIFISEGGAIHVTAADTQDLAGIVTLMQTGTLQDFPTLSGFTPITNYLVLSSGVSINLNTFIVNFQSGPAPGFLNATGSGVLFAPTFDPTPAVLTWTGNTSDNVSFTFAVTTSAHTEPQDVPEPMTLGLVGFGLVGLFGMARRRSAPHKAA